jgi:type IV pilus assembly protein PilO
MAKSLHELSPRAQIAVFAILAALAVGAAWRVLLGPMHDDLVARRTRLAALQGEVAKAQVVAAKLKVTEREVHNLEASLRETEAVLPDEKDPQDVLRNLHDVASDSLLDIESFKPKPIVAKAQYTEWPIELGLEGGYHDLGRFFDRLAAMPRLISVSDLEIKTKARPNGRGTIAATCIATTYVFQKDSALEGDQP